MIRMMMNYYYFTTMFSWNIVFSETNSVEIALTDPKKSCGVLPGL
eukprot:UN00364